MPSHWKVEAREAGYDPKKAVEVPRKFGKLEMVIAIEDMKNATIGNGTGCSGAKCIKRVLDADWAWVGASTAYVAPKGSKRLLRFLVNGLAKKQDRTMNVVGEKLILRAPARTASRKYKIQRNAEYRERKANGTHKPTPKKTPERSLAATLRSN